MTHRIRTFGRDGLTFDVVDEGPIDGEVVVLLHGFPQTNTSWREVAPLLHQAGYRTIAPNQRGYSPGAQPRGRRAYRPMALVEDISALIDLVGSPVHLVGHDWGAAVAWWTAINRPDLLRSLTAISVPHTGAFMSSMHRGQILKSWYMLMFNIPWLPERLLTSPAQAERGLVEYGGMPPAAWADYQAEFLNSRDRVRGGLAYYRAMAAANPLMSFRKVRVPTTYIWSDRDTFLSRVGADLCGRYVKADYRFEVISSATHWILNEEPKQIAEAIIERAEAQSL